MQDWLGHLTRIIKASGVSQQDLADHCGVDRTTLSRYLGEKLAMPTPILMRLLGRLGASLTDLQAVSGEPGLLFRSDVPDARELPAVRHALHRFAAYAWLEDALCGSPVREATLPTDPIPWARDQTAAIADFARRVRGSLGLPTTGPLPHLVEQLQATSLKVLRFSHEGKPDGFSVFHPHWGHCLALNTAGRSVERVVFTAAHELGHVVLGHTQTAGSAPKSADEAAASCFAGHFLVPGDDLRRYFQKLGAYQKSLRLATLKELKHGFCVSADCMLYRLRDEALITDAAYGHFRNLLYPHRRTDEPFPIQEKADCEQRLRVIALAAYEQGIIGEQKLAEVLGISLEDTLAFLREEVASGEPRP